MKMTPEHFAILRDRVTPLLPRLPALEALHQANPRIKDPKRAALWDVYHAARIYELFTYQQWDYDDSHIETAMRRIIG